jgi:hypothetical protein
MWDYKTGLPFQHLKDIPQPGSLDAEAVSLDDTADMGIADRTGCILLDIRQDGNETYYRRSRQDDQSVLGARIDKGQMGPCMYSFIL